MLYQTEDTVSFDYKRFLVGEIQCECDADYGHQQNTSEQILEIEFCKQFMIYGKDRRKNKNCKIISESSDRYGYAEKFRIWTFINFVAVECFAYLTYRTCLGTKMQMSEVK